MCSFFYLCSLFLITVVIVVLSTCSSWDSAERFLREVCNRGTSLHGNVDYLGLPFSCRLFQQFSLFELGCNVILMIPFAGWCIFGASDCCSYWAVWHWHGKKYKPLCCRKFSFFFQLHFYETCIFVQSKFPTLRKLFESLKALPEFVDASPERQPDALEHWILLLLLLLIHSLVGLDFYLYCLVTDFINVKIYADQYVCI